MKRSVVRSPYAWTVFGAIAVVVAAWVGRDQYQGVLAGAEAPDFTTGLLGGGEASLSDYRGKVVLVNIWATWCGPCLEEMPSMQRMYEALEGEDFEILAVSVDAPLGQSDAFGFPGGDLDQFVTELGLTFPILHQPTGAIREQYQTTGVPESFLVGPDGIIVKKVAGPTAWDSPENLDLVRRLLAD